MLACTLIAVACKVASVMAIPAMAGVGQSRSFAGEADAPVLEEIVVTGDRRASYSADFVQAGSFRGARQLDTPLTINVIPDALIQSQQATGLLDALRNIAGVSPAQISTTVYSNIAIRGIEVENRGNYRLNGILPIINLVDLPLEDKDRVEALKGASALYYGFSTPAGIINLTMKRPTPSPYVAATLVGNEHGSIGGHIDLSSTWGRVGARLNALYGSVDSGIDNTRGYRSLMAAAIDFRPVDNVAMTLDLEHIVKRVNEPGVFRYRQLPSPTLDDLYPALQLPPLLDPTVNFGPGWASNRAEERNILANSTWNISPALALSVSYGNSHIVRDRHFNTIDLDTYGPGTNGDGILSIALQPGATFENDGFRAELESLLLLWSTQHRLLFGASRNVREGFTSISVPATCPGSTPDAPREPCRQNVFAPVDIPETPFPLPNGPRTRIDDIGYYLFDRIELAEWLQVLVGVRRSDYEERNLDAGAVTFRDSPTSVSYGVVLKPRRWMSIYGSYIEGLESTPAAPMTAANAGELLPATDSTHYEAGIKVEPRAGLLMQAAYFDIERGTAFVNGANLYVIDGRARYRGIEASVTGEVTRDWSIYATGQILDAKQISGADTLVTTDPITGQITVIPTVVGRRIENTPEYTLSIASEYRFTKLLSGFSVNGGVYYISERATNQYNQAFIPGYTLVDLGVAYTTNFNGVETTLRATAQNVAGKKYFSSTGTNIIAQAPPPTMKLSIAVRF
jgi:iron complex outermembrane receptor protein